MMRGMGEGNFLKKVPFSHPPRPLLSSLKDFRVYRIPHSGFPLMGTCVMALGLLVFIGTMRSQGNKGIGDIFLSGKLRVE